MKKQLGIGVVFGLAVASLAMLARQGQGSTPPPGQSEIQRGFAIAPVPLDLHRKNRSLVGLGSYIVNAQASCNDCHSCPSFSNSPFDDGQGAINATNYLAGGVPFGPFQSANLTPDSEGRPAGLTLDEFFSAIRTGHDPDSGMILQVMPWFILRNMTDHDLRAVYEYLRSIPHADAGTCNGPGE